jgi:hypothetical protein
VDNVQALDATRSVPRVHYELRLSNPA